MAIAKYGAYYLLGWLMSFLLLAMIPSPYRDAGCSCPCGVDFRVANKDLAVLVMVLLPISFVFVLSILIRTIRHKKKCLVKIVSDV